MLVTELSDVQPRPRRVAVGEFDGVHLGHREVISGADTVLTFEPHPLQVVRPEAAPKLLTSLDAKADLIGSLGVQDLVVIPFDRGFADQTPEEFIDHVLVQRLQATRVSVGENFRFGHRAAGEVELAQRFLGAPFRMSGEVVHGDERGRTLGFPTANIVPDEALVTPGHGIYVARTGDGACAAVSIGVRPTFGTGRAVLVEAYLIDRDEDLYGRILALDFLERLRGERRFSSKEELIE